MYLIESRLNPVLKSEGISSIGDLVMRLRWQNTQSLQDKVIDVMTTNETSFFRDAPPFEALKKEVIQDLMKKREAQKKLVFWSAACSSGQEAYSILILLRENFPLLRDWEIDFYATDISDEILEKAQNGIYSSFEVSRGLSDKLVQRYFTKVGTNWQIRDSIREVVTFEKLNLLAPYTNLPRMDVIFLRNVLIYFDVEVKKEILLRAGKLLRPDGYLFLGQSETTKMLGDTFEPLNICNASCFRMKSSMAVHS